MEREEWKRYFQPLSQSMLLTDLSVCVCVCVCVVCSVLYFQPLCLKQAINWVFLRCALFCVTQQNDLLHHKHNNLHHKLNNLGGSVHCTTVGTAPPRSSQTPFSIKSEGGKKKKKVYPCIIPPGTISLISSITPPSPAMRHNKKSFQ